MPDEHSSPWLPTSSISSGHLALGLEVGEGALGLYGDAPIPQRRQRLQYLNRATIRCRGVGVFDDIADEPRAYMRPTRPAAMPSTA